MKSCVFSVGVFKDFNRRNSGGTFYIIPPRF